MSENRFDTVRELVKDPSLRVTEIAWKTGYNKGHVSRLRKEFLRQELCRGEIMSENKNAKTPADGPVAWQCQCGKAYTVTCISSKPPKKEWVGLTADEIWKCNKAKSGSAVEFHICSGHQNVLDFAEAIEAKLREKNT